MKLLGILLALVWFLVAALPVAAAADLREQKLARYLALHQSPLGFFAADFVREADRNNIDYRLLPAIAGVESSFGKNYIAGTYNVYGWGRGAVPFLSWPDGISRVSARLRQNYYNKGAIRVEDIARIYDPPGAENWTAGVHFFMAGITATPVLVIDIVGAREIIMAE